uniref:developmentally-regulated GTP-binding protein 1 homolog n=1 Tax=Fragaria vesca subsp. vesca TaxID=101020 RepID=UPI0005C948E1|nr:PREDICTED: developmentally-regulated GTP-binding protein 1 homolog [Fragaria vesca subsp. vesca]
MPCIYAVNKIDQITLEELEILDKLPHYCPVSISEALMTIKRLLEKMAQFPKVSDYNQHVQAIIGYIPITPSELNSLQRHLNHDDDGFIGDEYIEDDEYSDQFEEDDEYSDQFEEDVDSDDSDYHEYD